MIKEITRKSPGFGKRNHLTALCGILKQMGSIVLMLQLESLLPLLVQSLDLEDNEAKAATIETLTLVLQKDPVSLVEHVPSILARLIRASAYFEENNPVSWPQPVLCDNV